MGSPVTTHILDTSLGKPAAGVSVSLERKKGDTFVSVGHGITNEDGRIANLISQDGFEAGTYRIHFAIQSYFEGQKRESFYPEASIVFIVKDPTEHFHVPLLLNPFGYSTYRGS